MTDPTATIPIRTEVLTNKRGHWAKLAGPAKRQVMDVLTWWSSRDARPLRDAVRKRPITVHLTRIGPRAVDSDGAVTALKHVRDALAEAIGIKGATGKTTDADGASGVWWSYGFPEVGEWGVRVAIRQFAKDKSEPITDTPRGILTAKGTTDGP